MPARNATPGPSTLPQQSDAFQPLTSKKRGVSDYPIDEEPRFKKHRKDLEVASIDHKSAATNLSNSRNNKKRRKRKKKKAPRTLAEIDQDLRIGSRAPAPSSLASSTTLSLVSVSPPIDAAPQSIVEGTSSHPESSTAVREESEKPPISFIDKGKGRAISEGPDSTLSRSTAGSLRERDSMQVAQAKIAELTAQLESQKKKLSRYEDNLSHLQQSLTCEICLDLLYKPYALNPCGHVACYMCLVRWFTNVQGGAGNANIEPPTTLEDVHRLLTSPTAHHGVFLRNRKTCPLCRAAMVERPVEIWSVKSMVANLVKSRLAALPSPPPPSASETPGTKTRMTAQNDPWRNVFRKSRMQAMHALARPPLQFYPPPPDHHEGEGGEGGEEAWGIQDMGMYDAEDGGIYRCLDCMHEIWGGACSSCYRVYPGHARFDEDDDDGNDDGGEAGENFLGRRLREIQAHNLGWDLEVEEYDDEDDEDDDMDAGEYFDWEPAPEYWGGVGLTDEESLSGGDFGEDGSSEGAWSSDEGDHERPFFDAMQEVEEEGGIAHIDPVEEDDEALEPNPYRYHSDSASGDDSDLHERPVSDDEERYEDSFIDDEEEGGATGYNTRRTRQHLQNGGPSVVDLVDSEDESEGRHSDLADTDEESLDARAMARRLGRGMRLGGGGADCDSDEEPFRRRGWAPQSIISMVINDVDDDDDDDEGSRDNLAHANDDHRIYADDDDEDDDDDGEEEEEVRPRRTGFRRRRYHLVEDDDSDY